MTTQKNAKIANLQFILSIMIVMIHSANVFINLPGNEMQYVFGRNCSTFIQLFFSEGVCRVAVPLFFLISGYLFYRTYDGSFLGYKKKLKRRFTSLVLPYLFWSAAVFFLFYFAQRLPALSGYFTTRNASELNLRVILDNIILDSYNSPLWFCRYLIVFAVLAPILYQVAKKVPILLLALAFYGWFFGFWGLNIKCDINMQAVFFYCLGAVVALHKEKYYAVSKKLNKNILLGCTCAAWLLLLACRTLYFCNQNATVMLNGEYDTFLIYSERIAILLGMGTCWYGYDRIFGDQPLWSVSKYSFLLFVCHHPLVNTLKKLLLKLIGVTAGGALLVYFLAAMITIVLIILFGWLIYKFARPLWKLTSGGR